MEGLCVVSVSSYANSRCFVNRKYTNYTLNSAPEVQVSPAHRHPVLTVISIRMSRPCHIRLDVLPAIPSSKLSNFECGQWSDGNPVLIFTLTLYFCLFFYIYKSNA